MGDQPAPALALLRRAAGFRGVSLPGAPQARAGRLDPGGVEADREQPPRKVLRADAPGPPAARVGGRELAALVGRDLVPRAALGGLSNAMRLEHWRFTAPLRLRSIFRRGRVEDEMDEELRFHLEHKIEEGIAEGLSPSEARRRALAAMGGLEQRKEEIRDARRVHWLTDFVDDVRYATRSLRRTPWLSAFIVVTIAVGIGMTATPLSMLDALIFRPYPVPHPGRVVTLVSTTRDDAYGDFSHAEYLDLRDHTKSYDGVVASSTLLPVGFVARPGETPAVRGGQLVSANYFRVLGVDPQIGRAFRDDEDQAPGRDAVVVLAPDFWRRDLGADPAAVGRT